MGPSAFSRLPHLSFRTPTGRSQWVTQGRGTCEHSPGWSSAGGRGLLQTNQRQPAMAAALRPRNATSLQPGTSPHLRLCTELPGLPRPSSGAELRGWFSSENERVSEEDFWGPGPRRESSVGSAQHTGKGAGWH